MAGGDGGGGMFYLNWNLQYILCQAAAATKPSGGTSTFALV